MSLHSLGLIPETLDAQFRTELAQLRRTFVVMLAVTEQDDTQAPKVLQTIGQLQEDWDTWLRHHAHRMRQY